MSSRREQEITLRQNYLPEGVAQKTINGKFMRADGVLSEAGASKTLIRTIFTSKGELVPIASPQTIENDALTDLSYNVTDLRAMHPLEVMVQMAEPCTPYYKAVDISLKSQPAWKEYGFAEHGMISHIFPTALDAYIFIAQAELNGNRKIKKSTPLVTVMTAITHDIAGILERKYQTELAPLVTKEIIPWFYRDYPDLANQVDQVNRTHSHSRFLQEIQNTKKYGKTADTVIKNMAKKLPPALLALRMADTFDRGRHRRKGKSLTREAFEKNNHALLNYFLQTDKEFTKLNIDEEKGQTFTWNIAFTPYFTQQDKRLYEHTERYRETGCYPEIFTEDLGPNGEQLVYIPERFKKLHQEKATPYFDLFQKELWNESYDKMLPTAIAAFALFPDLLEFKFVFQHPDDPEKTHEEVLKRGEMQTGIDRIMKNYGIPKSGKDAII